MKSHVWSKPIVVYEACDAYVCKGCGTSVATTEQNPESTSAELGIPADCDEAKLVESRPLWDSELAWYDDVEPKWE